MTRRAARVTQAEVERALRAASAQRSRSGEVWRVRVEADGSIILEPQPKSAGVEDLTIIEDGIAFGQRRRFVL